IYDRRLQRDRQPAEGRGRRLHAMGEPAARLAGRLGARDAVTGVALMERIAHAHLDEVYPLLPFEPVSGRGVFLEDADGRQVLDFYGGHAVAALGYGHAAVAEAVARQVRVLSFQSNAVRVRIRDEAAEGLAALAPRGLERVFFVNSG